MCERHQWCAWVHSLQMHPSKSIGLNGFSAFFFPEILGCCWKWLNKNSLFILNHNSSAAPVNSPHIALAPKIKNTKSVSQYRPISLCNIAYKVVTKAIANRLKLVLDNLISCSQMHFYLESWSRIMSLWVLSASISWKFQGETKFSLSRTRHE